MSIIRILPDPVVNKIAVEKGLERLPRKVWVGEGLAASRKPSVVVEGTLFGRGQAPPLPGHAAGIQGKPVIE